MPQASGGRERIFAVLRISTQGKINNISRTLMFETLFECITRPVVPELDCIEVIGSPLEHSGGPD